MANAFAPRANLIARASLVSLGGGFVVVVAAAYAYNRSAYVTGVDVEVEQPIPFSHHHHVAGLGIDCRYCHPDAETDAFAGMPATQTCMNCHSKVWADAPLLAALRESWAQDVPVRWRRVHDLPDFVYFDHSIHVNKGIGCETCHGPVDQMRLPRKSKTLFMEWCLDCHRDPGPNLRPEQALFSMDWQPPPDFTDGDRLHAKYAIVTEGLTDCSTCHR